MSLKRHLAIWGALGKISYFACLINRDYDKEWNGEKILRRLIWRGQRSWSIKANVAFTCDISPVLILCFWYLFARTRMVRCIIFIAWASSLYHKYWKKFAKYCNIYHRRREFIHVRDTSKRKLWNVRVMQ